MIRNSSGLSAPANGANVSHRDGVDAARQGYLDALAGRALCDEPHLPMWQRNYETGRLWAVGFRAAGMEPPSWPEGAAEPENFQSLLRECTARIGSIRPEVLGPQPEDSSLVVRAVVPFFRRGRIRE